MLDSVLTTLQKPTHFYDHEKYITDQTLMGLMQIKIVLNNFISTPVKRQAGSRQWRRVTAGCKDGISSNLIPIAI